jgi:hypothetical protein
VLFALLLTGRALQPAPDLLSGTDSLALTLNAPLRDLFEKGADNESYSVAGILSYKDPGSGGDVKRDVQVSVRGHTSRREAECPFPKLKLKFKGGGVLKIGTHCGEASGEALTAKYGRLRTKSPQRGPSPTGCCGPSASHLRTDPVRDVVDREGLR